MAEVDRSLALKEERIRKSKAAAINYALKIQSGSTELSWSSADVNLSENEEDDIDDDEEVSR